MSGNPMALQDMARLFSSHFFCSALPEVYPFTSKGWETSETCVIPGLELRVQPGAFGSDPGSKHRLLEGPEGAACHRPPPDFT